MEGKCNQCLEHSGQVARIDNVIKQQEVFNEQQIVMATSFSEINKALGALIDRADYVEEKVDKQEHLTEAVLRLGIAVENGNAETKHTLEKVLEILTNHSTLLDAHATAIAVIKEAPAKKALQFQDLIKGMAIATFVGGILALLYEKIVSIWKLAP